MHSLSQVVNVTNWPLYSRNNPKEVFTAGNVEAGKSSYTTLYWIVIVNNSAIPGVQYVRV